MALVDYSDSESEGNNKNDIIVEDNEPVISKDFLKNNSLFGDTNESNNLFDKLPPPLTLQKKNKKKKKRKLKKKKDKFNKKRKYNDIEQTNMESDTKNHDLIRILPKPKKFKSNDNIVKENGSDNGNKITDIEGDNHVQTFDIRVKQSKVKINANPNASFSLNSSNINNDNNDDRETEVDNTLEMNDLPPGIFIKKQAQSSTDIGVKKLTASSLYKMDGNSHMTNEFIPEMNDITKMDSHDDIQHFNKINMNNKSMKVGNGKFKRLTMEQEFKNNELTGNILSINENNLNKKEWRPTYEMNDVLNQPKLEIKTRQWDPEKKEFITIKKYTKTQRKKHQINVLAHQAQEMALKLMQRRNASYKTKAETQAKYAW